MLKELYIQNLILIEEAKVSFEKGFTVISGETGSGKSAIMEAIGLALGARTDPALIRHGAETGSVEAVFDLSDLKEAQRDLAEKGIDLDDTSLLIIKRTISSSAKTRAYINHRAVQLSLLKELAPLLLELVGQHANHKLFHLDEHREILDLYGSIVPLREEYLAAWKYFQSVQEKLKELKHTLPSSLREIERCDAEMKEIEEARLKEDEEDSLFATYSLLASSEERLLSTNELESALGSDKGVLSLLNRAKSAYYSLEKNDPKFFAELSLYPQILLEAEDLLHTLRRYSANLDANPAQLEKVNARLTLINRMKKKYGPTLEDVQKYYLEQKSKQSALLNLEDEIERLSEEEAKALKEAQKLSKTLSDKRKSTALDLAKKTSKELKELNMGEAKLLIEIAEVPLCQTGSDRIEFFLHSNVGERQIPLKEGASGGEIARVLLALHVLLAGKEGIGTLIFDEIDANIGGTTASLIGEKLKVLGKTLQVLSITHFPQVAKSADHHIQITKSVEKGRTLSQITKLTIDTRKAELARMGGES